MNLFNEELKIILGSSLDSDFSSVALSMSFEKASRAEKQYLRYIIIVSDEIVIGLEGVQPDLKSTRVTMSLQFFLSRRALFLRRLNTKSQI